MEPKKYPPSEGISLDRNDGGAWLQLLDGCAEILRMRGSSNSTDLMSQIHVATEALRAAAAVRSPTACSTKQMGALAQSSQNPASALPHERSERAESMMTLADSSLTFRIMIYRGYVSDLRPLVILNSVEYAMPPSVEFCEQMWANGLQVIFIERPGFGASTSLPRVLLNGDLIGKGATASAEAALIQKLLAELQLKQIILLGMGSSNPVCYRLSLLSEHVSLSVFSNVVFNKDILDVFRPKWLQHMFRQMVHSTAGLKIASAGIKHRLRKKPLEFFRLLMHQSPGDVAYVDANPADFFAAAQRFQSVDQAMIDYDLRMSLKPDPLLKDGLFSECRAVAFSGSETPDHWRAQLDSEAARLDIPVAYAPRGDFLAPYVSPDFFLAAIKAHGGADLARLY